jgi:hypothetical protein
MGPNPVPFSAPMGCNVHVTTRGWIQLSIVELSPFRDIEGYCTYRLFHLNHFGIQLGWAPNLLFLFSAPMGCNVHVTTRG